MCACESNVACFVAKLMPCGIVLDRHVPKTAGTTVRSTLRKNAALGSCTYVGYDLRRTWESRVGFNHREMAEVVAELSSTPPPRRRLCMEAHMVGGRFWSDIVKLRATPFAAQCPVVVLLRVREPLSWYRSYYDWGVRSRQERGDALTWGANFTDWLPPNMQCRFALHGTAGTGSEWATEMAKAGRAQPAASLTDARWAEVARVVRRVDVIAPLERLDESLTLALRLSGVLTTTEYKITKPRDMHGPWERQPIVSRIPRAKEFCQTTDCAAAVRAAAPLDHRLYDLAVRLFDAQWQRDGRATALGVGGTAKGVSLSRRQLSRRGRERAERARAGRVK
jgi:hypothetical protein